MRLAIDWDLCVGSGLCRAAVPGAIRLVPYRDELRAIWVGDAADAALVAAARACPTLAIRLSEHGGQAIYPPAPG
jgi:ferredoxin